MNLRDLAMRYQSQNIEDRRGHGPLEHFMPLSALQFGAPPVQPMQSRVASPLGAQAGFNDIPGPDDIDERMSAMTEAFSPLNRSSAVDDFRGNLMMIEMMNRLKAGQKGRR